MATKPGFDARGKFAAGNKAAANRQSPITKCIREATRDETLRCAHSLIKTMGTLPGWMDKEEFLQLTVEEKEAYNNRSRLQALTDSAVLNRDYKFIEYVLNRALGKIPEAKPIEDEQGDNVVKLDQNNLVDFVLAARIEKEKEDKRVKEAL